ncbi:MULTISPECIES: phosphodiester glycosidase family protein [unclassified Clostridium]|uniref:phosphodiester glycosidase family protein n=1 Tax=unclassified Clostridium TaxID=2614128 RepID=UPI0013FAD18B|nr:MULTISPECIES: phosphodiester glycosidase family protein [unclassified Clostridium]MBN1054562.1 exopolysaccharide biosynthesis protein [Clostridium botulinum]NFT06823.1 exopolysaccharide biosynthesis protein [Clostridium botulinum]
MNKKVKKKPTRKKKRKENKKKKSLSIFMGLIYVITFLVITTPLVLIYGPYEKTKKVLISTVIATRHSYLVYDFIPQKTLDNILGKSEIEEEAVEANTSIDLNKIDVKCDSGNKVTKYDIHTERYDGYMLEIENPHKVKATMTKHLGKLGQKTSEMAEEHNAIAAINGGTFLDKSSDGVTYAGTGGQPGGFVISNGKVIYPTSGYDEHSFENVIAFTKKGQLIVGDHTLAELKKLDVQEAMCFRKPNIIINGIKQIKDRFEDGVNPRTAVGQKEDGTVLFLVLDGRKLSKPGASLYDVQEIMKNRGAINAGMLDGGYSTTMYYKGDVINSPNAWDGERTVATAFYVEQ